MKQNQQEKVEEEALNEKQSMPIVSQGGEGRAEEPIGKPDLTEPVTVRGGAGGSKGEAKGTTI